MMLDALENLKSNQRQLDMDGCEVAVSRHALEELIAAYEALSTATPPDVAGLIAELEAFAAGCRGSMWQSREETIRLCEQAATALRLYAGDGKIEHRKFYHRGYSTAELLKARKSPPEFFTDDGEAWRYKYTHVDSEGGAYDVLYRPASPTVEAGR